MSQLVVEHLGLGNGTEKILEKSSRGDSIRHHYLKFQKNKNFDLAKRALRKLVLIEPQFDDLVQLARYEFECQSYAACLQVIDMALEIRRGELKGLQEIYRTQGACLIYMGQFEKAEDSLYKALEYPGEIDAVLVNLGTLDIQRKSWESATISFREAIKLNSSNDKAWVGLSLCHRFKGDHVLAFGNLELALDIDPLNETALGLLLAWYGDSKEDAIYSRLCRYLLEGGENENLWLSFVELARRKSEFFIAHIELERLKLTHPDFAPAYQLRA